MGLSRNKVAVPEGAAGTPPFWKKRQKDVYPVAARQKAKQDKKEHLLSGEGRTRASRTLRFARTPMLRILFLWTPYNGIDRKAFHYIIYIHRMPHIAEKERKMPETIFDMLERKRT